MWEWRWVVGSGWVIEKLEVEVNSLMLTSISGFNLPRLWDLVVRLIN
jgi:hypothetical protein